MFRVFRTKKTAVGPKGPQPGTADASFEILRSVCANNAPARMLVDLHALDGRFGALSNDTLEIALVAPPPPAVLVPSTMACVTFCIGRRTLAFLSPVREIEATRVLLGVPDMIASAEARQYYRVPIAVDCPLKVTVIAPDRSVFHPQPIDISLGGISIQFSAEGAPPLAVGDAITVSITWEDTTFQTPGLIRHSTEQHRYGVFFDLEATRSDLATPAELTRIVKYAESRWLSTRLSSDDPQAAATGEAESAGSSQLGNKEV